MATKKKNTIQTPSNPIPEDEINLVKEEAYKLGKIEGSQEVWNALAGFVRDRMLKHFENRQDDLARELREILVVLTKNIT